MKNWPFDPLSPFCADLVAIDPPSDYENYSKKGESKGPRGQYECMSDEEIAGLPVGDLMGANSWLFLWGTAPKLPTNIQWMQRWGVEYCTFVVWRKVFKSGKPAMGCGYVARTMAEIVLIGKVGRPKRRKPIEGLFDGVRREHSRKPEEFYQRVDAFAPTHYRKADIFSRQSRPGWITWGKEATKFDAA
jgi:N6-adenosine-specific RNA methylase IME4